MEIIHINKAKRELSHLLENASEFQIAKLYNLVFNKDVTFTGVKNEMDFDNESKNTGYEYMTESERYEMECEEKGLL